MRVSNTNSPQTTQKLEEELQVLRHQNQRLKSIINALLYNYSTICEVNLCTGKITFLEIGSPLFANLGIKDQYPPFDELAAMYLKYGVYEEDRPIIQSITTCKGLSEVQFGKSIIRKYRNNYGIYGELRVFRIDDESVLMGFTAVDKEIHELQNQVYTDSLTHVKNRKYYDERLASKTCSALVIADIDLFKHINDTYGHLYGDIALASIASVLQKSVRDSDKIIRYGGDEFLIVFKDITPEILKSRLEKIRQSIESIQLEECPNMHLSMSFGAVYGDGTVKAMFSTADKLLYESKNIRNTITIQPFFMET